MNRGFSLLTTRSLKDVVDISVLEKESGIITPPLYKLFLQTFEVGGELVRDEYIHSGIPIEATYVRSEIADDRFRFVNFVSIEQSFAIYSSMYDSEDPVVIRKMIPIVQTASNAILHVGTVGPETDHIILDYEGESRFIDLGINIFEFVRTLIAEPVATEYLRKGVAFNQLYKNWGDKYWRSA